MLAEKELCGHFAWFWALVVSGVVVCKVGVKLPFVPLERMFSIVEFSFVISTSSPRAVT